MRSPYRGTAGRSRFIAHTEASTGAELPRFVKDEFDAFLECGILAHGFLSLRCGECGHNKLLAFSCERRGFCPSCGPRRMSQTAAHLVDHVIPHVPVRQWVLSLPIPPRVLLAAQPELVTPVLQVVQCVLTRHLLDSAQIKADEGHGGAVTLIQRFGSAANLNIHTRCLVRDGVYRCGADGVPSFIKASAPAADELHALLQTVITRLMKVRTCRGMLVEDMGQTYLAESDDDGEEARTLRPLQAAAITYRVAFGPRAGQKMLTLRGAMPRGPSARQSLCANIDGFSLHAAVRVQAHDRKRLEQLCRYITRPELTDERVQITAAGQVELKLKSETLTQWLPSQAGSFCWTAVSCCSEKVSCENGTPWRLTCLKPSVDKHFNFYRGCNMNIKSLLAALSIAGLVSAASAAPLAYNVSRTIGAGTVVGTVTTDGSFGALATANVVAWSLTLNDGTNSFAITEANSAFIALGSALTADIDSMDFDFSGSGVFDFQNPTIGSSINFWCANATGISCSGNGDGVEEVNTNGPIQFTVRQGVVEVATRSNAVPEPTALALAGLALLGAAAARRRV